MATERRFPRIRFLGGVGTVTGSKFLVEGRRGRVLVDCGLFQGRKDLRVRNWESPEVPPSGLDAILLTHAHVDHLGALPLFVREGSDAPVFSSQATADLAAIVLPDCGRLQEEEASFANRHRTSKHDPALPLFTEEDAYRSLQRFVPIPFREPREVAPGITATLHPAGHILGAASLLLEVDGCRIAFSGDLGRNVHPLLRAPDPLPDADAVVIESTYGAREHEEDAVELLADAIRRTADRGGVVLIPAFAVDRTEMLLFHLRALRERGRIPALPTYVDSPMALDALRVYRDAIDADSDEVRIELDSSHLDPGHLIEARTVDASKAIAHVHGRAIIISASGMATGGRVLHHLAQRLPGARNTVILPGHQVEGTRGHSLAMGEKHVKLLGQIVPVAAEVVHVRGFSSHADRSDLLDWLASADRPPTLACVVHGEPGPADSLRRAIHDEFGIRAVVPHPDQELVVEAR